MGKKLVIAVITSLLLISSLQAKPNLSLIYDSGKPWLRTSESSTIAEIEYSPLGTYIVAGDAKEVTVWNALTGEVLHLFAIPPQGKFRFSADERYLAFVGTKSPPPLEPPHKKLGRLAVPASAQVCVVDLTTGQQEWFSAEGLNSVAAVGFTADDSGLLAAGSFYSIVEWDLVTKALRRRVLAAGIVEGAQFSPKSNVVVWWPERILRQRTPIHVVAIESGKKYVRFSGHRRKTITACTFSRNGLFFATAGEDETIRLWNVERKRQERVMAIPPINSDEYPTSLSFNPTADRLVAGFINGPYTVVDVETGTLQSIKRVKGSYRSSSASPITSFVDLVCDDNTLKPLCPTTFEWKPRGSGHSGKIVGLAFAKDEKTFVSCDEKGRIFQWFTEGPKKLKTIAKASQKPVQTTAFSANGQMVILGRDWSTIEIFDVHLGKKVKDVFLRRWSPIGLAFSAERSILAVSCGRQMGLPETGRFIDLAGNEQKTSRFVSPRFLDSGETLLALGKRRLLDIDVQSARIRRQLPFPKAKEVNQLAVTSDGDFAICVTDKTKLHVINRRQWTILHEFSNLGRIESVALFYQGDRLAIACHKEEKFLSVYSVKTGEMLCEMKRSPDIATALTCSPEGNFLLVGDETGSIELYRVGD